MELQHTGESQDWEFDENNWVNLNQDWGGSESKWGCLWICIKRLHQHRSQM